VADVTRGHTVPATQFLRPNGRRNEGHFTTTAEVALLAAELIERGYRFECEELSTGQVHVDCCGPLPAGDDDEGEDGAVAVFVCPNDERVLAEFDTMVRRAHARVFAK